MKELISLFADTAAVASLCGILICILGVIATARFAQRRRPAPSHLPAVTILKPLCGDEPMLEEALLTCCRQKYPDFQIVFGSQDVDDPALKIARRMQARFPDRDIDIVCDATRHGPNHKVGNLINMLPAARHDILVICDSDLHVAPDYLERLVAALEDPQAGLVTSMMAGEPAGPGWAGKLGASHMNHTFLPSLLLSRALGRQDCLGGTAVLRRETLRRCGGLEALAQCLADDNLLGQLVTKLGLQVRLADTIPTATVSELTLRALWPHEVRWMRTIRGLTPVALAASTLQYPIVWAALAIIFSMAAPWSITLFAMSWIARAGTALAIDRILRRQRGAPVSGAPLALLPLRDFLSVAEIVASYFSNKVVWRGRRMNVRGGLLNSATRRAHLAGLDP